MIENPYYISKEALEKLKEEYSFLQNVKKREVADRIEKAKELGDLSENAEYTDAKDEMSFVEGKILELRDQIGRSVVIEKQSTDVVSVGNKVTLDCEGEERNYHIVGPNEADPAGGKISNETPLAVGLLGKKIGDEVEIKIPIGILKCVVKKIE
jgi:transcription elongation factor GreA